MVTLWACPSPSPSPSGSASAVVYGTSIVIQHRVAQEQADDEGVSAAGLLRLIKHPTFLLAIGGDFIGFLLQLVALSTGPVVIIQPLVVLMLPVSLLVSFLMGGHRPQPRRLPRGARHHRRARGLPRAVGQPGGGHVPASAVPGHDDRSAC